MYRKTANCNGDSRKKISWVSFLLLDRDLHKTSQIEILRKLAERGHATSLFGINTQEKYVSEANEVNIHSIPMRYVATITMFMYSILLFLYLPLYCLRSKQDYIIVEPRDATFLCATSLLGIPKPVRPKIVLDIRSVPVGGGFTETWLFNTAIKVSKKFFDGITIITPMMRQEICSKFKLNPQSMGVWTSGVSKKFFNPQKYDKYSLRKSLGIEDKFVVFYHGSMGPSYTFGRVRGVAGSIESLKILRQRYPDVVLFLLGDKESYPWIDELRQEYDVKDQVMFHNRVSHKEVPKYIASCDVALVPLPDVQLWRNQCALKLLEYLAMEKVVIATNIPANSYVLGESKCGVYISSASPKDVAQAIAYVHDNRDKLPEWGATGRAIVDEKFSWDRVAISFEEYLLRLSTPLQLKA